ncbi:MAG: M24 family metallopeptidase [Spirochaeta sp.]|jgi:Xaa-Pro aminopeptidase|nr:M24 family metallopeptidase [Spirochaeta sp.]
MMTRKQEIEAKLERLRGWMDESGLEVLVLRRIASLAWMTAGATTYVVTANGEGPVTGVVTRDGAWLLTNNIEGARLVEEEQLPELGWEVVTHPWFGGPNAPTPASVSGGELTPKRAGADVPFDGTRNVAAEISRLRSRLLPIEQARFTVLGAECAAAMSTAAGAVVPGQSEYEIAGHIAAATQPRGIQAIVNLVATDERMHRYRHPLPTTKKLERHALLVMCGRRDGLVASVSRIIHFGPVPEEIRRAHEAVAYVDGRAQAASRPGRTLGEVFTEIQDAYREAGFPDAWQGHHQGGVSGYEPREYLGLPDSTDVLEEGMVVAWNPSLPGAKSEDSVMVGAQGPVVLTDTPQWPMIETVSVPRAGILVR